MRWKKKNTQNNEGRIMRKKKEKEKAKKKVNKKN